MAGNAFGVLFRVTTWGESHGKALGVVIDGCPPGWTFPMKTFGWSSNGEGPAGEREQARGRRKTGGDPFGRLRGKNNRDAHLSSCQNENADSTSYDELREIFRPGHADYTYQAKYGLRDHRGGGRASARETVARVAAGAVAKKILFYEGITVLAYTAELGGICADTFGREEVERNFLRCPDSVAAAAMEGRIEEVKRQGDTLGGIVEILVRGCPPGLGEPVFDKLEADLAKALMSIGAVRGVEVGAGFGAARMTGRNATTPSDRGGLRRTIQAEFWAASPPGRRSGFGRRSSRSVHRPGAEDGRSLGKACLLGGQRPARCLRHPPDQLGL